MRKRNPTKLTYGQVRFFRCFAKTGDLRRAKKFGKASDGTFKRWLADPLFVKALAEALTPLAEQREIIVTSAAVGAAEKLAQIAAGACPEVPDTVRRACVELIRLARTPGRRATGRAEESDESPEQLLVDASLDCQAVAALTRKLEGNDTKEATR